MSDQRGQLLIADHGFAGLSRLDSRSGRRPRRRRHVWSVLLVHPLLIGVLVLTGIGCAKRDWVSDLLVLTDVSGTWEGSVKQQLSGGSMPPFPITLVLQQSGPKVTGELSWSRGQGRVEGLVNGEVLTFSGGIKVELAVDGDEMWGRAEDPLFASTAVCRPCFLRFWRVSTPVPAASEPPTRREP
jgi:hypothetical protein